MTGRKCHQVCLRHKLVMHSTYSSGCCGCRLPERIRPTICAFGGLADSFLPFRLPDGGTAEVKLASVVMKAAQARMVGGSPSAAAGSRMESAGKIGDDVSMSKAQVAAALVVRTALLTAML